MKLEEYADQPLDTPGDAGTLQHEPQVKQGTKRPRTLAFNVRLSCAGSL